MKPTLRERRNSRKLTLTQVGAVVGTTEGNLSKIERGLQQPSVTLARALAAFFDITVDEVLSSIPTV